MNSNAPPPAKEGFFTRLRKSPARMSLPARAATVVAIFLVMLVVIVWSEFLFNSNNFGYSITVRRILLVIGCMLLLPFLVYEGLRTWLEGDRSRFPQIDFAWNAGLQKLVEYDLSLNKIPLFIVAGSHGYEHEKALMQASGIDWRFKGIPEGPAPIHWYASEEAVFLFLSESCQMSTVASLLKKKRDEVASTAPTPKSTDEANFEVTARSSAEVSLRLKYVCRLINRVRRPLCPANGILVLLSFSVFRIQGEMAEKFEQLVRADLAALDESLQVRCPVMSLIVGMEDEAGFRELIRRMGPARTRQRFGKGYEVRSVATADDLSGLAEHVSGGFEDWVYSLFREPGTLSRPGNRQLFALLCQVRMFLRQRLGSLLSNAVGFDPKMTSAEFSHIFCGCYFAAVGDTTDRQAFVKGATDKLIGLHEEVEWTRQRLAADRRHARLASTLIVTNVLLITSLLLMVFNHYTRHGQ